MSELPTGWATAKLSEIAIKIGSGSTPSGGHAAYVSDGTPLIRSMNVHFSGFNFGGLAYIDDIQAKKLASAEVRAGDVLLNITGASIGRVTTVPATLEGARVNQHVSVIRMNIHTQPEFVSYYLSSPEAQNFIASGHYGATRQALTKGMIENFVVPVAPIVEQRRIVNKIDGLFARSRLARGELRCIEKLIKRFKDRLLEKAFSGKLTGDWREAHQVDDWTTTVLQDLLESGPSNGWSPVSGDDATGARTLKLTATTSGRLRLDAQAVKRIYETPPPNSKYWLQPGDILVQRANAIEHVGVAAIFDGPPKTYIFPDLMMRIRARDSGATKFLWLYLRSPGVRAYFRDRATGTSGNMPKINGETLRSLPVPNVSALERDEIVRRVEHAFAAVDRLAAEAQSAQAGLDKLDQAILAKAFRGELVPQDPNDEPASVLLDRIQAERAAAGPAPKRGRRPRSAAGA